MAERIKTGVIGMGFAGPIHIENLRRLGNIEVYAIAGRNKEKTENKAKNLGIPKAYSRWKDLINDPHIEAVHITTPNNLHFPIAKEAIMAGKHVICEKPLALDSKEAELLVDLAKKKKIVNSVTFNLSFYPMVRQARKIVSNDSLGNIYMVHGKYLQDWLSKDTDYNWRVDSETSGKSRVIADIGSHWIHMVQLITGKKIMSVFADSAIFINRRKKISGEIPTHTEIEIKDEEFELVDVDTEDYASMLFRFKDDVKGCLVISQVCPGRKQRIEWEINGSKASMAWSGEEPNKLWIGYRERCNETMIKGLSTISKDVQQYIHYPVGLTEGYPDTLKNIFIKIYEHIEAIKLKGKDIRWTIEYPTFSDGLEIQRIVDSILQSIKQEKWINV